ncbi:MAG: hypothetical protein IMZ50_04845 [Candidatus Atribacteria bacterium]|nr:hypothetical protein [Candidatus Atribacteria bacterium]
MDAQSCEQETRETVHGLEIVRRTWTNGRPWITIYNANRKPGNRFPKPFLNFTFPTWEQAEERIKTLLDARVGWELAKTARKQERAEYVHDYKPGDILYASWGYDQTNIDFYQVVAVPSSKSITVREIGGKWTDKETGNSMAAYVLPVPDSFKGAAQTKRVAPGGSIKFASYKWAYRFDGRELYSSWYA